MEGAAVRRLAREMFVHVLTTVLRSKASDTVLVVTASGEVADFSRQNGAQALIEQTGSLNAALELALCSLRREGYVRATVISADLPFLNEGDITLLSRTSEQGIAIAPDLGGSGTNGLSIPMQVAFRMRFGNRSALEHVEQSLEVARRPVLVHARGLATDIDLPMDLIRAAIACETGGGRKLTFADDIKDVVKMYWKRVPLWSNDRAERKLSAFPRDYPCHRRFKVYE
jgi:2-phospho-L-lactate guanylyltransferase